MVQIQFLKFFLYIFPVDFSWIQPQTQVRCCFLITSPSNENVDFLNVFIIHSLILFVAQGDPGPPGKMGPSGPEGERGPKVTFKSNQKKKYFSLLLKQNHWTESLFFRAKEDILEIQGAQEKEELRYSFLFFQVFVCCCCCCLFLYIYIYFFIIITSENSDLTETKLLTLTGVWRHTWTKRRWGIFILLLFYGIKGRH